ncbi:MAG: hypothetical protein IJW72_04775 [Alphaproteobacteria bacterium]|nr:hypothetical protein [Alphaproteobacteria bacterium]
MADVYANGGKHNDAEFSKENDELSRLADNVAKGVGSAVLLTAGYKLTVGSARLWDVVVSTSSPADDTIEKLMTVGGMGVSGAGMVAGLAITATGAYVGYKLAKEYQLKEKFLRAAEKAKKSKLGQKVGKFITVAQRQVADGKEVMDVYVGDKYQYSLIDAKPNEREDGKSYHKVKQIPKVISNFIDRKFGKGK